MALIYPDYRTATERAREAKREAAERKRREEEISAARRAEIDRRLELRELFPDIADRDLATTGMVAFAFRLQDSLAMETTWLRLWHRSHDAYVEAVSAGDAAAAGLAKDEVDQITAVCGKMFEAFSVQEALRAATEDASSN